MSGDTKALRTRIKSVNSTLHLTKAMNLVASSKIRKASDAMQKSKEYEENLAAVLHSLSSVRDLQSSPFIKSGGDRTRMIVIAGDRGLAGGYNSNIFRFSATFSDAEILPIGYRACMHFDQSRISSEYFTFDNAHSLAVHLCADFAEGKYDRLGIIATQYISAMTQEPFVKWIFPLKQTQGNAVVQPLIEPSDASVLNAAAEEYAAGVIYASVKESFACEIAARRMAMDNAEKNAKDMIDNLKIEYNRVRQGAITQEITEITAGNES